MRDLTPFGVMVKKRLVDKRMTQAELAIRLGITRQYMGLILHGERSGSRYVDQIKNLLDLNETV